MMATEILRDYFLEYEDCHPNESCTVNFDAACPIIIDFCDASANAKGFSEATVDFFTDRGLPLAYFFQTGQKELSSYMLGTERKSEAIVKLEEFFADDNHIKCLHSLHQNQEYSEYNIQVILAAHLFGPLAGRNSCMIGNKGFPKDPKAKTCPVCTFDVSAAVNNTSLGNDSVWHGNADILVKQSVVKLSFNDVDDVGDGSDEPVQKQMRTGSIRDDSSYSDESFDSESIDEDKKDVTGIHAMSEGLAQTIVNAFCEVKENHSLSNTFIPSFIATGHSIRITMYNCEIDRLIMTKDLKIFTFTKTKPILNFSTILSVWYALNFENFIDNLEPDSELYRNFLTLYKESKFQEHAGHKLSVYKKNCSKPMTLNPVQKNLEFELSVRTATPPVSSFINKMVMSDDKMKSVFKEKKPRNVSE